MHRLSGQEDLCLGTPANGRTRPEFVDVVGYCVNPVVLRSHYEPNLSFTSYLTAVSRTVREALEHQDYPFPALVEKLNPPRLAGISPLFQAMVVWQKAYGDQIGELGPLSMGQGGIALCLPELILESITLENNASQFDLTLMIAESEQDLLGVLKYNADLFDADTIRQIGTQLAALLEAISLGPEKQLSSYSLATDVEREKLLLDYTSGESQTSTINKCIHELFEEQAKRNPESVALIVAANRMTYAELNARANQFARHLCKMGVGTDVRVGICLNRSVEMIVAVLGIWKAGAAYVPFDPRDPKERLSRVIRQSSMEVLVTHEQLLDRLPDELPQLVLLDLDLDVISAEDKTDLSADVPMASLAYVIYTSGTTGEPKGVMIEHHSVANLLASLQETIYGFGHGRQFLVGLNAPLAFDSSVKQMIVLALGHTLCLVPEEIRRNGKELVGFLSGMHLDVVDFTPSQLQLLRQGGFGGNTSAPLTFLVGGEAIPSEVWKDLAGQPSAICYNLYGPTECTVDATVCRIEPHGEPSIGRPLSGVHLYLLDETLEPVPRGVPGEIVIGGEGVGRGYLDSPKLTAEMFVPDPFRAISGSRMYRTGDRAVSLADGKIRFTGRSDRQVKIRGFRIELEEIEHALRACAGVTDAAVVVRTDAMDNKQLVGYVVASDDRPANQYRQLLAQNLPEHMVPAVVISVPLIPISPNFKRDYSALPVPEFADLERGSDYVAPESRIEEYLVDLWVETLRVRPIGIHDNFFALGGDSLQATKLIAQIQDRYPTDTPLLALFFQEPTIAALAQFIAFLAQPTEQP